MVARRRAIDFLSSSRVYDISPRFDTTRNLSACHACLSRTAGQSASHPVRPSARPPVRSSVRVRPRPFSVRRSPFFFRGRASARISSHPMRIRTRRMLPGYHEETETSRSVKFRDQFSRGQERGYFIIIKWYPVLIPFSVFSRASERLFSSNKLT